MTITRRAAFAAAACGLLLSGCYTDESLIAQTRNRAIRTRIDEVELGSFRVTLPRDLDSGEMTEIQLRVFGESERYKINEIKAELEAHGPQIEDTAIRTLRETPKADLVDPELKRLRKRLVAAINAELTDAPLRTIGFYDVRFVRH